MLAGLGHQSAGADSAGTALAGDWTPVPENWGSQVGTEEVLHRKLVRR